MLMDVNKLPARIEYSRRVGRETTRGNYTGPVAITTYTYNI